MTSLTEMPLPAIRRYREIESMLDDLRTLERLKAQFCDDAWEQARRDGREYPSLDLDPAYRNYDAFCAQADQKAADVLALVRSLL